MYSLDYLLYCILSDSDNYSNDGREQQNFAAASLQSLPTSISHLVTSNHLPLDIITVAINNHMKSTIITTEKSRKQINKLFGQSLTSVDAYIKERKFLRNKRINTRK